MRKQKNTILALCFACALLIFPSCERLEYDEEKAYTDEIVWSEIDYVRRSLSSVYERLPSGYNSVLGSMQAAITDNAESSEMSNAVRIFNDGTWNEFNNPMGAWGKNYEGIRQANFFITNADTTTFYTYSGENQESFLEELDVFRGEARFLKAFFYAELIKRYGGVPIIKDVLFLEDEIDRPRNTYEECVDYIAEVCNEAASFLPDKRSGVDLGRASKAAAYALKARTFLYAASPLNNEGNKNDSYYDSCVAAAAEIFSMGYSLNGVSYSELFTPGSPTHIQNKEVIFDKREISSSSFERDNVPVGFYSGRGYTNPTQGLVDAYEWKDGTKFDWNNPEHVAGIYSGFEKDTNIDGVDTTIYIERDERFYATIVYNGDSVQGRTVECFNGGKDGPNQKHTHGTRTGYYLNKYVDTELDLLNGNTSKHIWFYMRYAEVLLNYAEALNEIAGPDDNRGYAKTALEALNEVRERAGQPLLTTADVPTKETFREKVRNERRVELAFEEHRYWDVKRWKIAEETLGVPIHGVEIIKNADETLSFNVKEVENRVFEPRMYLFPIPAQEFLNSDHLKQNDGW